MIAYSTEPATGTASVTERFGGDFQELYYEHFAENPELCAAVHTAIHESGWPACPIDTASDDDQAYYLFQGLGGEMFGRLLVQDGYLADAEALAESLDCRLVVDANQEPGLAFEHDIPEQSDPVALATIAKGLGAAAIGALLDEPPIMLFVAAVVIPLTATALLFLITVLAKPLMMAICAFGVVLALVGAGRFWWGLYQDRKAKREVLEAEAHG